MIPNGKTENQSLSLLPDKSGNKDVYVVKLPVFEGPFELLYYLIKKEEINIWDISLSRITEEYLDYLQKMRILRIDTAGNFLVMASTLLNLKSKLLLPRPWQDITPKEEDGFFFGSKEELVHRLLEYSRFKAISLQLKQRETEQNKIFLRSQGPPRVVFLHRQSSLCPYSFKILQKAFGNISGKDTLKNEKKEIFTFPEEITLLTKINSILESIKKMAKRSFPLDKLLGRGGKKEIVVTFLALLELGRRGRIYLTQQILFGKIRIFNKQ